MRRFWFVITILSMSALAGLATAVVDSTLASETRLARSSKLIAIRCGRLIDGKSEEAILKSSDQKSPSDWSLDGRFILYHQNSPDTQSDIWVLPLFGDRQPIPFLQTKFNEGRGVFSPDARWIAYESNESGSYQVYVQSFPPSGGKWQISSEGGRSPRFRRDGKELFYLAANGKLTAVEVKTNASSFEFSVPKPLFEAQTTGYYAVTGDGQRFLLNTPVEESASAPITVVLNWAAELKR